MKKKIVDKNSVHSRTFKKKRTGTSRWNKFRHLTSLSLFPFLLQQALRSRKKGSVFLFYFPQNTQ